jgi:dUTP pyrophosphatase
MTDDLQNYIKELIHLKKLGLISNDELNELDELLVMSKELESAGFSEYKDVNKTEIKFVNTSENPDPIWAKDGDSGFDLRANISGTIKPLERLLIPTGLYFELPDGYDMEIKSRSGLASKHGIGVLTGTIDLNYKGEVMVLLFNISNDVFNFQKGDRLAQSVVRPRVSTEFGKMIKLNSIKELSETERGSGGFGSTGKN